MWLKGEEICSRSKRRETVAMKEAVIVLGRRSGILNKELAAALGMDPSAVTKRMEAARLRREENVGLRKLEAALAASDVAGIKGHGEKVKCQYVNLDPSPGAAL